MGVEHLSLFVVAFIQTALAFVDWNGNASMGGNDVGNTIDSIRHGVAPCLAVTIAGGEETSGRACMC